MTENKQFHLKIKWKDYKKTEAIEIVLYDGGQTMCKLISVEDARLVRNILNDQHKQITSLKSTNMELEDANARLEEKNIKLQERNDRQYDKLTHLWECIRNKDYETLKKEWEEIEEADKKLQEEWECYND